MKQTLCIVEKTFSRSELVAAKMKADQCNIDIASIYIDNLIRNMKSLNK